MADMRDRWLVGFEGGEYVVYDREKDYLDGGPVVGEELGRAPVLADALDMADRAEREIAIESRMEEAEAMRAGWATMTSEERNAYLERQAKDAEYARRLADLTSMLMPSLPVFDRTITTADRPAEIRWRSGLGYR